MGQRRRFRGCHIVLLEHLARALLPGLMRCLVIGEWLELAPFDAAATSPSPGAGSARPNSRGGGAPGGDGPPISDGGTGLHTHSRRVAAREERKASSSPWWQPLRRLRRSVEKRHDAIVGIAPRRASVAVMPFADTR